ncbi:MAG: hypothetical protein KDC27_21320, partial [Acidobacteria bacterium]|nr:hypothetical protein [Acidobacteriota bacterium]
GVVGAFLNGNLLFSDRRSRVFETSGETATLFAGFSAAEWPDEVAASSVPAVDVTGMTLAPNGDLYFVAGPTWTIHSLASDGILRRVAGNGDLQIDTPAPDGSLARDSSLEWPLDVAFDQDGRLLFTEWRANVVRAIDAA